MNIDSKDVLVRMLSTPNPYALKFVLNVPLKNKGNASFYSKEEVEHLPLFNALFDIKGLKQIFVFQNQMTLTHDGSVDELEIEKQVTAIVGTRVVVHDPSFQSFEEQKSSHTEKQKKPLSPQAQKIDDILDRTVRPGLQADGGDLEVLSVEKDEVRISYQGACSGCPSAFMGTLSAVENILRQETGNDCLKIIPIQQN